MNSARNGRRPSLAAVKGFMFDLDGTLILTDRSLGHYQVLPHAVQVLCELKARGIPFVTMTNGTNYPAAEQAPKLRAIGLPIEDDALLTPSTVAAALASAVVLRTCLSTKTGFVTGPHLRTPPRSPRRPR